MTDVSMVGRREFIVAALGAAAGIPCSAHAAKTSDRRLRVGIVSDIHVTSVHDADIFETALQRFDRELVDAVMVCGDLTTTGRKTELKAIADVWKKVFRRNRRSDGGSVEKLFISGNHDVDGYFWPYSKFKDATEAERESFFRHREEFWRELFDEEYRPVVVKTIKGYTFVLKNWQARNGSDPFGTLGKGWKAEPNPLPDWFARHRGELPTDRPFFLVQHEPPAGTCTASVQDPQGFDNGTTTRLLSAFSNAFVISGHTHHTLVDETSIWQGSFTSINAGCLRGYAFTGHGRENGHAFDDNMSPSKEMPRLDISAVQQGLLMDVFDSRVVFRRIDFKFGHSLGDDWVVPIGTTAARQYDPAICRERVPAPQFGASATVCCEKIVDGCDRAGVKHSQIEVRFPTVNGRNGSSARAADYRVDLEIFMGGEPQVFATKRVYSPNGLLAPEQDVGDVICRFPMSGVPRGRSIRFTVRPVGYFGREGDPVSSERYAFW